MKDNWVGFTDGNYINMGHVFRLKADGTDTVCYGIDGKIMHRITNTNPTELLKMMDTGTNYYAGTYNPAKSLKPKTPINAAVFSLDELEAAQDMIAGSKA